MFFKYLKIFFVKVVKYSFLIFQDQSNKKDGIGMIILSYLILIFIFILDILKFKFWLKFLGLINSCIGKILRFFKKLNLLFLINKYLLFFL